MTKFRTVTLAVFTLLSVSFLASGVEAADGIMMKDGKATGPMDHAMTRHMDSTPHRRIGLPRDDPTGMITALLSWSPINEIKKVLASCAN